MQMKIAIRFTSSVRERLYNYTIPIFFDEVKMEKITIEVDNKIAKAYREAEINKQQKMQTIINDLLKQMIQNKTLDDIIQEVATKAKNNELTQENLDDILNSDSHSDFDSLLDETQGIWEQGNSLDYQQKIREEWS